MTTTMNPMKAKHPLMGLVVALALEPPRWSGVSCTWDFDERVYTANGVSDVTSLLNGKPLGPGW